MKLSKPHTGKKEPTPIKKKEAHADRKTKKAVLHELKEQDWQEQLKEYNADSTIQE